MSNQTTDRSSGYNAPRNDFRFDLDALIPLVAHGGIGEIKAVRVASRAVETEGNFIDMVLMPSGTSIGIHSHNEDDEEIYVIIEGNGTMFNGREWFPVGAGHVIVNRPGGTHGLINTGESDLKLVVIDICATNRF